MTTGSHNVCLTTDKAEIYAFLQRDPVYGAYAIGDLEETHFAFCTWYLAEAEPDQPSALALVYRRLDLPILLTMGDTAAVAAIFGQADLPKRAFLSGQVEHLPLLEATYDFVDGSAESMQRMTVTPETFRPASMQLPARASLRRLEPSDVAAIDRLISSGGPFAPDSFSPPQVEEGVFFGLFKNDEILAMAGTHLVASTMRVAAVGNVYTHPSQRGRGYSQIVSSVVTEELLRRGLQVVLNVNQSNTAAIHIYEKLGYRMHCPFVEGIGWLVGW